MGKFRLDSPIFLALSRASDFIILNVLFIVTSLPIVTIGTSATTLYYVMGRIIRKEEGYVVRDYFRSWKENFKQSAVLTLISLLLVVILFFDLRIMGLKEYHFPIFIYMVVIIVGILILLMMPFAFALLSRFRNTVKGTVKNAFLLTITHPVSAVLIAAGTFLPVILFLVTPYHFFMFSLVWILFGFALTSWLCMRRFCKIFEPLEQKAEEGEAEENDE